MRGRAMRVIKRKRLPGEPICKDCNYPLDPNDKNVYSIISNTEARNYDLPDPYKCTWLTCKKCKTDYLVEGYYDWKKKLNKEDDITIDIGNLNIFRWFRKRKKKVEKWQRKNK